MNISAKHRISALLLALTLLSSAIGINIFTHTCQSMGRVDISLFSADNSHACSFCQPMEKSCCSSESKSCSSMQDGECCLHDTEYIKLDFDTTISEIISKIIIPISFESINYSDFQTNHATYHVIKPEKHFSGISPPFSKHFIHFISLMIE